MAQIKINQEVFDKMVGVLAQLPYNQIAGLMQDIAMEASVITEEQADESRTIPEE